MVLRIRLDRMISLLLMMIPPVMIARTVQRSYLHEVLLLIIIKLIRIVVRQQPTTFGKTNLVEKDRDGVHFEGIYYILE